MKSLPSLLRRLFLVALCLAASPAGAEPLTIRFGFASVGVDSKPFTGGTPASTAHAGHYVDDALKDEPDIKVEWYFFKGAGPAVNEAIANGQLDFAWQGDLPSVIGRASGLKTKILLANGWPVQWSHPTSPGSATFVSLCPIDENNKLSTAQ